MGDRTLTGGVSEFLDTRQYVRVDDENERTIPPFWKPQLGTCTFAGSSMQCDVAGDVDIMSCSVRDLPGLLRCCRETPRQLFFQGFDLGLRNAD